ncbi:hypothetical protein [Olleya sp. AS48]|uniref:hypothetical protein n=1 Tax=Olleya sp. AS48 TaxID=3135774 RepID=UPI00316D5409
MKLQKQSVLFFSVILFLVMQVNASTTISPNIGKDISSIIDSEVNIGDDIFFKGGMFRFQGFGFKICASWGDQAGGCKGGIIFQDPDFSVSVNGKEINSLDIEALGIKEKYSQDTPIEVVYNPLKSKEKIKLMSTPRKILFKNNKTGEVITLASVIEIKMSCGESQKTKASTYSKKAIQMKRN